MSDPFNVAANIKAIDITETDWVYRWMEDNGSWFSNFAKGYISGKLDEIYNSLSSDSEDFREEFIELAETAIILPNPV